MPPPPGYLTFLKNFGPIPCYVGSLNSQMPHWLELHKVRAEISDTETTFLDTSVYKSERFTNESVLDILVHTHYKPTETYFNTYISPRVTHQELRKN